LATKPYQGRYAATTTEPFVVFLIGMRINKLFHIRKWFTGTRAFLGMYNELLKRPESGFLGGQNILYWRGAGQIQYWRSFEDLERFGRDQNDIHVPAWRRYNKMVQASGTFGVWHETYLVEPSQYEAIYANMPPFGLGAVKDYVPATGRRETARRRLGGSNEPAVPSPATPVRAEAEKTGAK
jgi:fumigallin biosynthesis monooxygenase-like protein